MGNEMRVGKIDAGGAVSISQQTLVLPLPPDHPAQLTKYLYHLIGACQNLTLGGLTPDERERENMELQGVFIGLDGDKPIRHPKGEIHAALAQVVTQPRLVILGDPGSGKSTLLRFVAFALARAWLEPTGAWLNLLKWTVQPLEKESPRRPSDKKDEPLIELKWAHPLYIPIMVTLRDFAATDFNPDSKTALWEFIKSQIQAVELTSTIDALLDKLQQGQAILLLDGVDEVPAARRALVWQAIGQLHALFPQCPWVTTCRILSYNDIEAATAKVGAKLTLAPFTPTQIEAFVTHWYDTLAQVGEIPSLLQAKQDARHLISLVKEGKLYELAKNPMLLTIIALVHSFYGTLPDQEAKLYQICINALVVRWQNKKEAKKQGRSALPSSLAELGLSEADLHAILQEIGWVAHQAQPERTDLADISQAEVQRIARKVLKDSVKAAQFIQYTEQRAHLLIAKGGQHDDDLRYTFPHRTFQEYLAGRYLSAQPDFGWLARPLAEAGSDWRKVLLLAAGNLVYNNQPGVGNIPLLLALRDILPQDKPTPQDNAGWQAVWRASEMLAILGMKDALAHPLGQKLLPRAREYLTALVTGEQLTPYERAQAGQTLAHLGDERPGIGLKNGLPDITWCDIAAGTFTMGRDDSDEDEKPAHKVTLPQYQISQYPVTQLQYKAFVDDGGYTNEKHWDAAMSQNYWTKDGFKAWQDDEPRTAPYRYGNPFDLPNHPVVGVTWYEAVAFCVWFSEKSGRFVRLPTEAEWERAARGLDGRLYPWESTLTPSPSPSGRGEQKTRLPLPEGEGRGEGVVGSEGIQANCKESRINSTCAVGLFPSGKSPEVVYDLSGQVWEWCSTLWQEKYTVPRPPNENEWHGTYLNQDKTRVLRGGAYYVSIDNCYGSTRDRDDPRSRYFDYGFRLVRFSNK